MRATATLTAKLERGLLSYATAASAAGVGILALAQSAHPEVIYTPADVTIFRNHHYAFDLNDDGVKDFLIRNKHYGHSSSARGRLILEGYPGNSAVPVDSKGHICAAALARGIRVGTSSHSFHQVPLPMFYWCQSVPCWPSGTTYGPWDVGANAYLGLKFVVGGETHFGWARVKVTNGLIVHLKDYAFETIPDKPIIAGNRGSTTGQGPEAEPVSLGRLALGAAGRTQHRQKVETSH